MAKKNTTKSKEKDDSRGKVIVSVRRPKRTGTLMVRSIYDYENGAWVNLTDDNGNEIEGYPIRTNKFELDLDRPSQKSVYEVLRKHPIYYNCDDFDKRLLDIEHVEKEAKEKVTKKEKEHEAIDVIKGIENDIDLSAFARVLGIPTKNMTEWFVRSKLYAMAEDMPEKIIKEWNDENRETKEILMRAKDRGVITVNNGYWYYYQQFLGDSFERTLSYLLDNDFLIPKIREAAEELPQ